MIGIADADAFYASCERVFNLNLIKKPVTVLSSNDGNVIALTEEAKRIGIKMGDPFFRETYLAFDFKGKRIGFADK